MIKTILVDYAGVITPTSSQIPWVKANTERFNMSVDELFEVIRDGWSDAKINKITSEEYWKKIAAKLNVKPEILKDEIIESFPVDKRVIDLVARLHEEYITVLVSNQIQDWLEKVIADNNLNEIFDHNLSSYNTGFSKPDRRIFEEVLTRTKSKYDECLLIDDQTKNTTVAESLGMSVILCSSYESLLEDLVKQKIISNRYE